MSRAPISATPTIMIAAGEASGDLLGGGVARALRGALGECRLFGIGGDAMREAGVETLIDISELSVMGLVEVVRHYPRLRRRLADGCQLLAERRPALLIAIDYPGFNLRLAAAARALQIPVLYFVSPQVWAWRPGRIQRIGRLVDHMAVLFPFEQAIYRQAGIDSTFVGHPVVERMTSVCNRQQARTQLGIGADGCWIGLLPGSRPAEIERHLPLLIESAARLHAADPGRRFLIPRAPNLPAAAFAAALSAGLPIELTDGDFSCAVAACDVVAVASGTATLEVALAGTPMVVLYRMAPLTFWLLRRLVTLERVSLVNIVLGREVVRELLQGAATPAAIAGELTRLLGDHRYRQRQCDSLATLRSQLEPPEGGSPSAGVAALAARMLAVVAP